jgi:ubiquinone biosynthesis protein UbiJ
VPKYNIGPFVELIRIVTSGIVGSISSPESESASAEAYQRSLSGIFLKLELKSINFILFSGSLIDLLIDFNVKVLNY